MATHNPFTLSMSGGGLSSVLYVGFVDVLQEHGIDPTYYAGISGGAIVSALLASNMSPAEITEFFVALKSIRLLNIRYRHLEVVDHHKLIEKIRELLPYKTFEHLPKPAIIIATDLVKKEPLPITSGDLASAIVASCSVFPFLQPVHRRGHLLGDGGFTAYYGAQFLKPMTNNLPIIGIDVVGINEGSVTGLFAALYKQMNSTMTSNANYEMANSPVDFAVQVNYPAPSIFSIGDRAPHLMEAGRKVANKHLQEIKKALQHHEQL